MNPAQLQAFFAAHKVAVLGAGAAGAVLLGLRSRKKAATGPARTSQPAGTLPAAAVVPANGLQGVGSTYDSSAYDVYSALQSELTPFLQAQAAATNSSSGVSSVPAIASTLFKPTGSGSYVRYTDGTVAEVESDGSQYGMTWNEWNPLVSGGASYSQLNVAPDANGYVNTLQRNLTAKGTPAPATVAG